MRKCTTGKSVKKVKQAITACICCSSFQLIGVHTGQYNMHADTVYQDKCEGGNYLTPQLIYRPDIF